MVFKALKVHAEMPTSKELLIRSELEKQLEVLNTSAHICPA